MITRLTLGLTVVKLACGDVNNKGVPLLSWQAANNLLWRIHSIHTILSNTTEAQHGNKELERWTEYCRDLKKDALKPDASLLQDEPRSDEVHRSSKRRCKRLCVH